MLFDAHAHDHHRQHAARPRRAADRAVVPRARRRARRVRRRGRGPCRAQPAVHGRAQPPPPAPLHAQAHRGVERHGRRGRRLRLRHARVQLWLHRATEECDRLPALGMAVQAGGPRQLRRYLRRDAGRADDQAGRHDPEDDAAARSRFHPFRQPIHRRRGGAGERGDGDGRDGDAGRTAALGGRSSRCARAPPSRPSNDNK
jgi:hypothetical protein